MTDAKVITASNKASLINQETQSVLDSVKNKGNKAVNWFVICFLILFILGVASYVRINQSINKQNEIATQNKQHIDCVVKLFTTPLPTGARARTISNPSTTCNINFTP